MPTNAFTTYSKSHNLKKRLDELILHSKELKFLVGYFYFSGWQQQYECLRNYNNLTTKLQVWLEQPAKRVRASRNPLESPWALGEEEFVRRVGRDGPKAFKSAREETLSAWRMRLMRESRRCMGYRSDRPRIFHEYSNGSRPFVNSWFYSRMVSLREIGLEPAESTSRNPLESPWSLGEEDFVRRAGWDGLRAYKSAREETVSVTEEAIRVESEIDERVESLYGV